MKKLLSAVVIGALALSAYQRSRHAESRVPAPDAEPDTRLVELPDPPAVTRGNETPPFRCDGRTHCSQMTSCEEATFFLQNCPGVKMDGDRGGRGDGVPCERQWCGRH
jgi:hypothetical protein